MADPRVPAGYEEVVRALEREATTLRAELAALELQRVRSEFGDDLARVRARLARRRHALPILLDRLWRSGTGVDHLRFDAAADAAADPPAPAPLAAATPPEVAEAAAGELGSRDPPALLARRRAEVAELRDRVHAIGFVATPTLPAEPPRLARDELEARLRELAAMLDIELELNAAGAGWDVVARGQLEALAAWTTAAADPPLAAGFERAELDADGAAIRLRGTIAQTG